MLWVDKVLVSDKQTDNQTDKQTDECKPTDSRHGDISLGNEMNSSVPSLRSNNLTCINSCDGVLEDCKNVSTTSETRLPLNSDYSRTVDKSKQQKTVLKPVIYQEEPFEWQRTHIGHKLIADHWPHEYQKTLKLFLQAE